MKKTELNNKPSSHQSIKPSNKNNNKVPMLTDITEIALDATIPSSPITMLSGRERSIANLRMGQGRAKGEPNKINKQIKDMIIGALNDAGGQRYLHTQANANPVAFMGLIGKVLPTELRGNIEGGITINVITGITRE
jgi:hypothetical protein